MDLDLQIWTRENPKLGFNDRRGSCRAKFTTRTTLENSDVPLSKVAILVMVIPPLIGNPYNGYINPYYWVDDHPLLYGNNGSLDPSTFRRCSCLRM